MHSWYYKRTIDRSQYSCYRSASALQVYCTKSLHSQVHPATTAGLYKTHGHPVPRICCVNLKLSHRLAICKLADRESFAPPSKARTKIEAPWRQKDVITDQFREELMTPECQLLGECRYNLLRPFCERAVRNFISMMEMRISGSFLCRCPEFSAFTPNQNTKKHFLRLIPFSLYTSVYVAYGKIQVESQPKPLCFDSLKILYTGLEF